ncbi:MAG: hypothetical protein C4334_14320 [Pyrinomonas sp.]|uniref:hypothetical protein n=1 Tax=Pyrinomonas sp. TaxID=2080306 RepID=UPI00332260FF
MAKRKKLIEKSDDGRYVLIDGCRWRATDPRIPEEARKHLVAELMRARRAMRAGDREAERDARARVHRTKVALGERGPKWWD